VVLFEHDGAHPHTPSPFGGLDMVDQSREQAGCRMDMDVDGSLQQR
jgi:hypothetical protein